jgi:S-adenosylmethionine hydrolase
MSTITLLTDFGTRGIYVGAMKGVIAALCPTAQVLDLTHEVTPQAIREGAFLLDCAYRYFPADTIHVAVVDPGVGTTRRAIALDLPGTGRFIGPDNGLFTPLLLAHPAPAARLIANPAFTIARLGRAISATFHGRDLFAPAAAALADGADFAAIGPAVDVATLVRLPRFWATPNAGGQLRGEIVHIDRFGNLISNIRRDALATLTDAERRTLRVTGGGHTCQGLIDTYGRRADGEIVALFGSGGTLEIARVNGRADRREDGAPIILGEPLCVTLTGAHDELP